MNKEKNLFNKKAVFILGFYKNFTNKKMATQLTQREQDLLRLIKSGSHIGSMNVNKSMERFLSHMTPEGVPIFNAEHTLNKIRLAARVIAGFQSDDVIVRIEGRKIEKIRLRG